MKISHIVAPLAFLACLTVTIYLFWPHYFVETKTDQAVSVLYNENDAYILAAEDFEGYRASRFGFLYKGFLGAPVPPVNQTFLLLLAHLGGGEIAIHKQTNFFYGGGAFIFKGRLHYEVTTNDGETITVWRWDGNAFKELETREGRNIRDSFELLSDLLAKEHWSETRMMFFDRGTNTVIKLNSAEYIISLVPADATRMHSDKVVIQRLGERPQSINLIDVTNEFSKVTRNEYLNLFNLAR